MNIDDDDFSLFGLPERFTVDPAAVEQRWRELQAQVHPDRFAAQGAAAQRVAMQWAVRVNQAAQRLRDPLRRAAYLCERRGVIVSGERGAALPPQFLQQQMAWREVLEEAPDTASMRELAAQVEQQRAAMLQQLAALLDEQRDTDAAAQQLRALMFVDRFARDLEDRLEAQEH